MAFARPLRNVATLVWIASAASAAHACTVCDSLAAHRVRAGIFNGHFLHTLLLVAAPFPTFAAVTWLLYAAMPDLAFPPATPTRTAVPAHPGGVLLELGLSA